MVGSAEDDAAEEVASKAARAAEVAKAGEVGAHFRELEHEAAEKRAAAKAMAEDGEASEALAKQLAAEAEAAAAGAEAEAARRRKEEEADAKVRNSHGHGQFKKVTGTNHARWRGHRMTQLYF